MPFLQILVQHNKLKLRQKKLRLKKQNKNNKSCLRKYIEGCSAAKLYSLYLFDNRIR